MKFLSSFTVILSIGFLLAFAPAMHGDGKYQVDVSKSTIEWIGKKLTGEHSGTLSLKSGEIVIGGHAISSANFEIDMTTISSTDLKGETAEDLINHLKADDFFGTEKFPTASIVMLSASPLTNDNNGNNYSIKATLTMKDIANEITFPARVNIGDKQVTLKANVIFDRTKWGIKYKSKTIFDDLGDKFIYDDIELKISIVANLQ